MKSNPHTRSLIGLPWHGRTLLILALLFLAAPNALADNPGAGCPALTTVNNPANDCFTVTPPVGSVVIDGVQTDAEWTGAIQKNITGLPEATIRFRRNGANLVFLVSVNDVVFNISDSIQLAFDPLHDHVVNDVNDIVFTINRNGSVQKTIGVSSVPWVPGANLSTCPQGCAPPADFTDGWQAEVVITPTDLVLPDLSAIVGFTLIVNNQNTADISNWPEPAPASAATWANIKTRFPIEYMVVLDQSGSMLSQSKWDLAKSATNTLAKTMAIVGEPNYFQDKLGVVTFAWNIGTDTEQTSTPKPLAGVPVFAAGDFVPDPPVITPVGLNYTPIGEGLKEAFIGLGTGVEETERVVLYLSDGLHNRPTTAVPLLPTVANLSYIACMASGVWSMCTDSVVKVNTVALGQDSAVDTALLNQIKNGFSGECFGGAACNATTYTITTDPDELKKFFIQSLDSLYQLNSLPDGPANTQFPVNPGERRLIVISSWPAMVAPVNFTLERSNDGVSWTPVNCDANGASSAAVGLAFCAVDTPTAATFYRATGNLGASRVFPLLDLKLRARFSIDQVVHGTGQDIVLRAALNEAGAPVTHDPATHPVKVTVSIKRPTEGFGTFVSTHDPANCAIVTPTPPPLIRQQDPIFAGGFGINFSLTAAGILAAATGPDVKPPRFGRIDTLFDRCGKSSLNVIEDPGLELFDDGTHGDVTANDGIYTLKFLNTQFEGSYVLNFKAAGKSPAGSEFSRVKTIAEYVRINVDPGNTTVNARDVSQVGNIVTREYYVTPRDRFGGYLGPGYPDQIVFTTTAGSFTTPVIDYNNGVYSQVLKFDRSSENPVVTGTVQGNPVGSFSGVQGFEFFAYIGGSAYQNSLGLNNGFTAGGRFGYRFPNQFALEFESGLTFSRFNTGPFTGQRAHLVQVLGNVRYDIVQWSIGNWTPYVITGAGGVFLNGGAGNDSAFAFHGGFGSTWQLTNHVGIRADGRVFRFGNLNGAPSTTSFQGNVGVVFRF